MVTLLTRHIAVWACLATLGSTALAQDPPAPKVTVAAAYTEELIDEVLFIGRGEAVDKADLVARVSGFVDEVLVKDGQFVQRGDVLFRIEPDIYEATLAAREADLGQANANLDLAELELVRKEELLERDVGTEAERDIAFANNQVAQAQVKIAESAVRMAQLDVDYTEVLAPFTGRIGRVGVSVGELVGPTTEPLVNIVRVSPIYVEFSLTERQFVNVLEQTGATQNELVGSATTPDVYVILPNGDELPEKGRVVFVDNRVDPTTATITVRAEFPNERELIIDGSFVTVRIEETEPTEALLIPQAAVQRDQRGDFVLVVGQQQTVEQRYITSGRQVETAVVVEDGLREGETVIVEGLQRVRPGVPVDSVLAGTPVEE
ncbi:efflux RND transporter periplasmic adaptor subunit [Tropicimonas sp. S265A]|uniref:efflux RND transporter periplasmic adaptor subunit n=1 Tax=Tropicimonas sp. S265A TaxID=3415134 RepID=UPI003C799D5C